MTKKVFLELYNTILCPEIINGGSIKKIDNIANMSDTVISYGMYMLLLSASVLEIDQKDKLKIGFECDEFAKLNKIEKIKFLLDKYLDKYNGNVNELSRLHSDIRFSIQKNTPYLSEARMLVIKYLKLCPIDKWINVEEFEKYIRRDDYKFLRPYVGEVIKKDEYEDNYFDDATHDDFENLFIESVLT